jgi:hypothetical protein
MTKQKRSRVQIGSPALGGTRVRQCANQVHTLLLQQRLRRSAHVGIEIPIGDAQLTLVAQEAVKRHPDLTIVALGETMVLTFRPQLEQGASEDLRRAIKVAGLSDHDAVASSLAIADGKEKENAK